MSGKSVCYKFGHFDILYMYTIICSGVRPPSCFSTTIMVHLLSSLKQCSGMGQGVARDGMRMGSGKCLV